MNAKDTSESRPRSIELLAPARNAEVAIEAIKHGADAVYMGAMSHGARAAAGNSLEDIERVVRFAHTFNARVYITVNTIIYDSEIETVERLIRDLYRIGVDALIVQDMALLRMNIPPIALHASTQCDIRDAAKARFLESVGFSQIVIARELSLNEMADICRNVSIPVETFVHGALCVSYSGDCQAGFATMRRSANRGECPQICRQKFDLVDGKGETLIEGKHLLSLRDLNRSQALEEMLEAGITSFKIEGRLKDALYVKNVVGVYRKLLDDIIKKNPGRFVRASRGICRLTFNPDLSTSFNRGFTDYFTRSVQPKEKLASFDSTKWIGCPIGKTLSVKGNKITAHLTAAVANGDGIGYFDNRREFHGFRINRVEGSELYAATRVDIPKGATLYRNSDRVRTAMLEKDSGQRFMEIQLVLRRAGEWGVALDAFIDGINIASVAEPIDLAPARTPQSEQRIEVLQRTGDTCWRIESVEDRIGDMFIPRSAVADLRRRILTVLERRLRATYHYDYRKKEDFESSLPNGNSLTYHDNVANSLAHLFYTQHGARNISPAIETSKTVADGTTVMTTRYCLRRECGYCRKTPHGKNWPDDLFLISGPVKLKVEFDCAACRMHLITAK